MIEIPPMTQVEEDNLLVILTAAFDGGIAAGLIDQIKLYEAGERTPAIMYQSFLRWIQEKGITGDDKTYIENYITKYPYSPSDFPFIVG